jgi:alpha-1,6-mannosyltransferase
MLLHPLRDVGNRVVEAILLLLLTNLVYLVSVFFILKSPDGSAVSLKFIFAAAILFRLTVWPLYPTLSDDPYRYRWEGKLQVEGGNPYQVRPADEQWAAVRDETFPKVGSKDFKGGYGPLIELIQRVTYQLLQIFTRDPWVQVFWFKLPGALFELGILAALTLLLRARGVPASRILIYAWSPVPIMEFWATGHNDSIAVFFVVVALLAAVRKRWLWAFVWLSVATAAKIWPILLFPAFILSPAGGKPRWLQWLVLIPIFGVCAAPYWANVTENAQFMSGFVGGWRNNDSLFDVLLWGAGGDLQRAKYLAISLISIAAFWIAVRVRPLEKAVLWTIVTLLLLSANCHAWYLTWFVPLLAFYPSAPLLLWTALMPISYSVLIRWRTLGEWDGSTPMRWYIFVPFFAFATAIFCRDRFRAARAANRHLP